MRYGTSHFESNVAAVKYYREQGYPQLLDAIRAVRAKIQEKVISIGKPQIEKGEKLVLDEDRRYYIDDGKK